MEQATGQPISRAVANLLIEGRTGRTRGPPLITPEKGPALNGLSLPPIALALLDQGPDPTDLPDLAACGARRHWAYPMAEHLRGQIAAAGSGRGTGFQANGHLYLLTGTPENGTAGGLTTFLQLSGPGHAAPRQLAGTVVVITLSGSVDLAVYRHQQDIDSQQPHYARTFGPQSIFACHQGTLCCLQSSQDSMQVVVTRDRPVHVRDRLPLSPTEVRDVARRAHAELGGLLRLAYAPSTEGGR